MCVRVCVLVRICESLNVHVCVLTSHLLLCDVQNAFQSQLFKVQAVTFVKVRADSLRVVVYHHCPHAHLTQGSDTGHCTPVKLHTAP